MTATTVAVAATSGGLSGPAGGTWEQGTVDRAQCAVCGSWVVDARAWRYWVGLVAKSTVCTECAESA